MIIEISAAHRRIGKTIQVVKLVSEPIMLTKQVLKFQFRVVQKVK